MKNRVTWNVYSAILLLDVYLVIQENAGQRGRLISALSQFLRGQIDAGKDFASEAYASSTDIHQKLGKMEYLMTDGQKGIPGAILPCMEEAVDLYKNDYQRYLLYKDAAKKQMLVEQLMVQPAKGKAAERDAEYEGDCFMEEGDLFVLEGNLFSDQEEFGVGNQKEEAKISLGSRDVFRSSGEERTEIEKADRKVPEETLSPGTSIKILKLSRRLENVLCRNRFFTIESLLSLSEDELRRLHGMGNKSLQELSVALEKYNGVSYENTVSLEEKSGEMRGADFAARKELVIFGAVLPRNSVIAILPLSNRLKNTLYRHKVCTVGDLLDCSEDDFSQMRGMGMSALLELTEFLQLHQKYVSAADGNDEHFDFLAFEDTSVCKLGFTPKINQALSEAGIQNLRDLFSYPEGKWGELSGLNAYQVKIVRDKVECYQKMEEVACLGRWERELTGKDISGNKQKGAAGNLRAFSDMISVDYNDIIRILREKSGQERSIAEKLWEEKSVQDAVKSWILRSLELQKYAGLSQAELIQRLSGAVYDAEIFAQLLEEMEAANRIRRKVDMLFPVYMSLSGYLDSCVDEKTKRLLTLRLDGETLEGVAREAGVTREWVRQIQKRIFAKMPPVEEGYWISIQKAYSDLTEEDFGLVFRLPLQTVVFLRLSGSSFPSDRGAEEEKRVHALRRIIHDFEKDEAIQKRAQERIQEVSPHFVIKGTRIPKKRDALIRYAIQVYCQDAKSLTELKECYETLRSDVGNEALWPSFDIDLRYFERYLNSFIVLSNGHKRLRYYDILANDYEELLNALDFPSYKNVTLSTLKFFRDYPEMMRQYDIRNEQELHSLLKKLWEHGHNNAKEDEEHRLTFEKMPMITFGKADRAEQIVQLLRENNPISYMDFAKLIEQEYGISRQTALANWIKPVEPYLAGGMYVMNKSPLPAEHLARVKELLTDDYYATAEIRNTYMAAYPGSHPWDIDVAAMIQMGFVSHGKYAIRNTYKNASDFFEKLFDREDIVDTRKKPELTLSSSYHSIRLKRQEEYQIIEVEPGLFYNIRCFKEMGIAKSDIVDFCKAVEHFVGDGKCFTVRSLKLKGFLCPWEGDFWSEWLYSALLSADSVHFDSRRFGKTKLLRRRKSDGKVTLADLLKEITDESPYMLTLDEISRTLQTVYGMETPSHKIREIVRSHDIFEDRILY